MKIWGPERALRNAQAAASIPAPQGFALRRVVRLDAAGAISRYGGSTINPM